MSSLWIFSGKVPLCEIGHPTSLTDRMGNTLHTGDIVAIYTEDDDGVLKYGPNGLTCVIELSEATDLSLHTEAKPGPWVMGIRNVDLSNSDWRVMRLKLWSDVIDGERWTDYGFSYKPHP